MTPETVFQSTRRHELAMPYFEGMDLGIALGAYGKVEGGDLSGYAAFFALMGKAGKLRTVRILSAIWRATETELKALEGNPALLEDLTELAAQRPISDSLLDAVTFQHALWESFGLTLLSFVKPATAPEKNAETLKETSEGSPSEG